MHAKHDCSRRTRCANATNTDCGKKQLSASRLAALVASAMRNKLTTQSVSNIKMSSWRACV